MAPRDRICCCLLIVFMSTASHSFAQNAVTVKENGKILAVSPGNITATAGGKTYTLKFKPQDAVVFVQGRLTESELQPGMIVRVTGALKGTAMDGDVDEVKIYTTADGYQAGVLQDAPDQPATITGNWRA